MKSRRLAAAVIVTSLGLVGGGSAAFASPHGGRPPSTSERGHHQRGKGPGGPTSTSSSSTVAPTTSTTEVEVEVEDGPGHM